MTELLVHRYAFVSASSDAAAAWLSPAEWPDYNRKAPQARRSWLLGRVLAKQLVQRLLTPEAPPSALSIFSRNGMGRGMRPQVFLRGRPLDCSLSISRAGGVVLVGMGARPGVQVGVDLTAPFEPASGFLDLFVTARERAWLETGRHNIASFWAVKEAAYKAVNQGGPFEPRCIEAQPGRSGAFGFRNRDDGPAFHGCARLLAVGPVIGALVACEHRGQRERFLT